MPFAFDQPYWGERTAALSAGPPPLPYQELEVGRLAAALGRLVSEPGLGAGAAALGRRLQAENGVERAAGLIERL